MSKKFESSMAIQIAPTTSSMEENLRIIDKIIKHIQSKGLNAVVGPFETTIEGDLDTILETLKECIIMAEKEGAPHNITYMKLTYNPSGVLTIDEKTSKYNK